MTEKLGGREETARVCQDDGNLHLGELQRLKSELEANDAAIDEVSSCNMIILLSDVDTLNAIESWQL